MSLETALDGGMVRVVNCANIMCPLLITFLVFQSTHWCTNVTITDVAMLSDHVNTVHAVVDLSQSRLCHQQVGRSSLPSDSRLQVHTLPGDQDTGTRLSAFCVDEMTRIELSLNDCS